MKASDASVLKVACDAFRAERERHVPEFEARARRIQSKLVRARPGRRIGAPLISAVALLLAGAAYAAQGLPSRVSESEVSELALNDFGNVLTATASNVARALESAHSNASGDLGFIGPLDLRTDDTKQSQSQSTLHPGERRGSQRPLPTDALSTARDPASGNHEAVRSPRVQQELESKVPTSTMDEWRHVANALANEDEHLARAALTRLAENGDTSTRAKALFGVLQLELTHHRCERVAGLARNIEDVVGPAHKLTRRARRLSNQCEK